MIEGRCGILPSVINSSETGKKPQDQGNAVSKNTLNIAQRQSLPGEYVFADRAEKSCWKLGPKSLEN